MLGTLRDSFIGNVSRWPERNAIIGAERTYTYADLNACVNQFANYLIGLGVTKGDAVGLFLNNCAEFAIQKLIAKSSNRDRKTRSRWAAALDNAYKAGIPPEKLERWFRDGGGVSGRAR